ncbi:hypothetical protein ACFQPF_09375 [Fictibacillus iocasae]|uniref:DUF4199 domain-containing protein n=1 Tax=Fictibacillus iocasae TaxID=2715437 RepID=A0ABW2NSD7_9BACL
MDLDWLVPGAGVLVAGTVLAVCIAQFKRERSEDMFRQLYMYLVLFVTLMMLMKGSVEIFKNIADLSSPQMYYMNYVEFKNSEITLAKETKMDIPSDFALQERYDAGVNSFNEQEKNRGVNNLIQSLGWIAIPLPVFLYFQYRLRRERKQS